MKDDMLCPGCSPVDVRPHRCTQWVVAMYFCRCTECEHPKRNRVRVLK